MAGTVKPIPAGYHSVTPYLVVSDGAAAIDFYSRAFDAREVMRLSGTGDKVVHAEIEIGGSRIMLAEEMPEAKCRTPEALDGFAFSLYVYVKDVDKSVTQAAAAGARLLMPVADRFWGDRAGSLEDPFGHIWHLATHREDVSHDEIRRRAADLARQRTRKGE